MVASLFIAGTLALGGAGAAVARRAAEREAAARVSHPPTGRVVEVAGRKVHVHVEGHGPDLILIHGASGSTRDFTFRFVDRMKSRYRVLAFDRPGLGWSDEIGPADVDPAAQAAHLRAAAAQLDVRRPVVVGHSYGGAVALAWALDDPEGTAAVVSLAGAAMPWQGLLGPLYTVTSHPVGAATLVPVLSAFVSHDRAERAVAGIFDPQPAPEGYSAYFGIDLSLRRGQLRINARQVMGLKPRLRAMSARYPSLPVPLEIVHGDRDTIVPMQVHSEPLARLVPGARLTVLPGVGHMPHHADPEAVEAAIDRAAASAGLR